MLITANIPEALIWVVLIIGWVILQAIIKNSRKGEELPDQPEQQDSAPGDDLDDFLKQLEKRAADFAKPEPKETIRETKSVSAPITKQAKPASRTTSRPPRVRVPAPRPEPPRASAVRKPPVARRMKPPVRQPSMQASELAPFAEARKRPMLKTLKEYAGRQQAMIFREIMGPPKALLEDELFIPGRGA